ncbi:hypothetical protein MPTA5024_07775 [Microbispora sp. ATCC PTA-5024]|nr:hypothetical protein MPTA5024_07775 [Microbispora sp. ATCC PTA-5024]
MSSADQLLSRTVGVWPRPAALLLRLSLEQGLREYFQRVRPELNTCTMLERMLCLEAYAGPGLARQCATLWSGLSQACHYHAYELSPTPSELGRWREEVEMVLNLLNAS